MSRLLSSSALKLHKCLRVRSYRSYTSDIKKYMEHKDETVCHPKLASCTANMGDCAKTETPICGGPNAYVPKFLRCCCDIALTKNPCAKSPAKKRKRQEIKDKPFKSMWEMSEEVPKCPSLVPRLDELHYKPSDKLKRRYTQTWETCGAVIKKKKLCCFQDLCSSLPPLEKRFKFDCPETAREQDSDQLKVNYYILQKCMETPINPNKKSKKKKCKKIVMPCCRKVSKITKCHRNRQQSKCEKECCPYPSFSECNPSHLLQQPPAECSCQDVVNKCDTSRFAVRKKKYNIPPPLPAWPLNESPMEE